MQDFRTQEDCEVLKKSIVILFPPWILDSGIGQKGRYEVFQVKSQDEND